MGEVGEVRSRALSTSGPTRVQPWREKPSAVWGKTIAFGPCPLLFRPGKRLLPRALRHSNTHEVETFT